MKISKLYKVGVNVVFYKPDLDGVRQNYYNDLIDSVQVGYDATGVAMSPAEAGKHFLIMCDYEKPTDAVEEHYRNISLAPVITAIVRESIDTLDPLGSLTLLKDSISCLSVGMFVEADILLGAIVPTVDITAPQIAIWQEMILCADAITV